MLSPIKTKVFSTRAVASPQVQTQTMANINLIKLASSSEPKFPFNMVAAFRPELILVNHREGTPKTLLTVPYTDENDASELLLYALNSDPDHGRYVPRYKIAVHRISGAQQFKIELNEATEGEGGLLKVSLQSVAPDEFGSQFSAALPMDHIPGFALRFTVPGTGIDKRLPFEELLKTDDGYDATLRISSFMEFSQVITAISDSDYHCRLEILRSVSVAVPQFSATDPGGAVGPNPILAYTAIENSAVNGILFNRVHLSIKNWDIFPDSLFVASPELPPCGLNTNASRTWLEIYDDQGNRLYGYCALGNNTSLRTFSFAVRADLPLPDACNIVLWDRMTNKRFTSNKVNLKISPQFVATEVGEKMYKVVSKEFLQTETFHFSKELHAYIFLNSGIRENVAGGFKPFRIKWSGDNSEHIYLQEEVNPKNFFYLPDEYILAREEAPLFKPKFSAKISGLTLADLRVTINYQADAYVDAERLEEALDRLTSMSEVVEKDITFNPLVLSGERLKFTLSIPGAGFMMRTESLLTLANIQDNLPPISLETFEELFDNLTNDTSASSMLTGHVEVDVPGIVVAPVPVSLRFTVVDEKMLLMQLLKNAIIQLEIMNNSPHTLSAQGVVVSVQDGENTLNGSKANLELPLTLSPGDTKRFVVIPTSVVEKPDQAMVSLNWEGMQQHNDDNSLSESPESFAIVQQQLGQSNSILVINPIESTLKMNGIKGIIRAVDREVPLVIKNLEIPVAIPPGESLSFDVVPAEDITDYQDSDLRFTWEGLRLEVDKSRLFEAIVDTSINATYESVVKVSLFIDPITTESAIRLLKVEFKNSGDGPLIDTIIFNASDLPDPVSGNIEKDIVLPLPVKDYVLGSANTGQYWFRIVLIQNTDGSGGSKNMEGDWIAKSGSLEITTELLPKG